MILSSLGPPNKKKTWQSSGSRLCHALTGETGSAMVDGTLVPLFEKPGGHGEGYYDRKGNYSLNVQGEL